MLKQILNQAVDDGIILQNPCIRAKKDAPKTPKSKKVRSLDREGFERMVDALDDLETKEYHLASKGQQLTSNMAHVNAARLALCGGLRISARLGHASINITLDLYGHAMRDDDIKCDEVIEMMVKNYPKLVINKQ